MNLSARNKELPYSRGEQNIITDEYQVVRLSEGCPHKCPWCREWKEIGDSWQVFPIPEIVRRDVRITDMNLLAKPEAVELIQRFKDMRVDGKVVYPWLVCGIDYRFLTPEIAQALKDSRFVNMHIAWDWRYSDQKKIKRAIDMLKKAGYRNHRSKEMNEDEIEFEYPDGISIFMVCNHPAVSFRENCKKLDLCKYWNVKVNDCYFDNQISPNIEPIGWSHDDIKKFRASVRKHNQIVGFGVDPEL